MTEKRHQWTPQEYRDALELDRKAFLKKYPMLNDQHWKDARYRARHNPELLLGAEDTLKEQAERIIEQMDEHLRPVFIDLQTQQDVDLDRFFDLADELQGFFQDLDSVITTATLDFSDAKKPIVIQWATCAHLGGRWTFHRAFKEAYQRVLDTPHFYLGLLGDEIEGFLSSFRDASSSANQLIPTKFQTQVLKRVVQELHEGGKLICGSTSQHGGKWLEQQVGFNPLKQYYLDAKVPYFDGMAQIDLRVGQQSYVVGLAHELPGSSLYNDLHPQARAHKWRWPNADLVVSGDKHVYANGEFTSYPDEFEAGRKGSPYTRLISVGTAKTGPDPFTIKRWSKGIFEWPFTVFWPDEHRIEANRRYSVALAHAKGLT